MRTHLIALAAVWGLATLCSAGELDREFSGGFPKAPATPKTELAIKTSSAMELDKESPTQAWHRRGGWGVGYGWGGGWGGYGWGRGWSVGWGGGHGWGYGNVGYYRPSFGIYASSYWPSYSYWPSSYYYPSFSYSYYPTWGYASYGCGYRRRGCCW